MAKYQRIYWESVLCLVSGIALIHFIIRFIFLIYNYDVLGFYYSKLNLDEILEVSIYGIYYDFIVVLFINFPYIIINLIPIKIKAKVLNRNILSAIFLLVNSLVIFIAIADIFYYKQAMERSSGIIISILDGFFLLMYQYSIEYWYGWILFFVMTWLLWFFYKKSEHRVERKNTLTEWCIFLVIISVCGFIGFRVVMPINGISDLVVNTPLKIINSSLNDPMFFNNKGLDQVSYHKNEHLNELLPYNKGYYDANKKSDTTNVVIITLESFSKDYVGFLNSSQSRESVTPFLDSLATHSLIFTNAYSNGKHSNEGIPAIYASLPHMMREAFIMSKYRNNEINGIAGILKRYNYKSAFFHGGTNGIYGFDFFAKQAGFDKYFGKDEYGNNKYYDGAWGIWDDKFFLYTAKEMDNIKTPFVVGLYSVSSHHPFKLPQYYRDNKEYLHPMLKSVKYTDYSLKKFFETIKYKEWFKNTLFVITSDHPANTNYPVRGLHETIEKYHIPLMFYNPNSKIQGVNEDLIQQIDIVPSVIDVLNLDIPYTGFGNSFMDKTRKQYVYHYEDGVYEIADNNYSMRFDGNRILSYRTISETAGSKKSTLNTDKKEEILKHHLDYLKAVIQKYNNVMNNNTIIQ